MKKTLVFIALILISGKAFSVQDVVINSPISPTFLTVANTTGTSVNIPATTAGNKNCLTNISLISSTISNMVIIDGALNGGTTIWGLVNVPAVTQVNRDFTEKLPFCGSPNSQMNIFITSGTASFSYKGFTTR